MGSKFPLVMVYDPFNVLLTDFGFCGLGFLWGFVGLVTGPCLQCLGLWGVHHQEVIKSFLHEEEASGPYPQWV